MDRLDAMSVLAAVVEAGSLSAAARRLGAPLPTVSRKLSELEAHLKVRLLVRSTRKLSLTDAGAAYLAAAKRILEQVDEAERAAAGEFFAPRGELAVAAPIAFGRLNVLPIVCDFLARFPEIDVRLALSDRNTRLVDEHIDCAVRIGALPDSAMTASRVGEVRRVVCGSPDYFAGRGEPKRPADLLSLDCVTFDALEPADAWRFRLPQTGKEASIRIRSRFSANTAEAAVDAAVAGIGVTRVLSYQAERAISEGKLRIVLAEFEPAPAPVSLLHPGQSPMPLKLRALLDFVGPRLRARLSDVGRSINSRRQSS